MSVGSRFDGGIDKASSKEGVQLVWLEVDDVPRRMGTKSLGKIATWLGPRRRPTRDLNAHCLEIQVWVLAPIFGYHPDGISTRPMPQPIMIKNTGVYPKFFIEPIKDNSWAPMGLKGGGVWQERTLLYRCDAAKTVVH